MADKFTLEAQPRTITGKKVSQLRRQGLVPAVVYGARIAPVHVQIPYRPLEVTLMKAGGTRLIDLKVDGKTLSVLAREVQRDVLRANIKHVDFFAVDAATKIRVDVPLHFVNESAAVESNLGVLTTGPASLSIETLPSKLLSRIEIDLTRLSNVGDTLYVRDLTLDEGIQIMNDPDEMIARISPLGVAVQEEVAEEAAPGEVEIIAKGKEEEDEEE